MTADSEDYKKVFSRIEVWKILEPLLEGSNRRDRYELVGGGAVEVSYPVEIHDVNFPHLNGWLDTVALKMQAGSAAFRRRSILEDRIVNTMTAEEQEQQRRSFAYGNTKIDNAEITHEMIDKQAEALADELNRREQLVSNPNELKDGAA